MIGCQRYQQASKRLVASERGLIGGWDVWVWTWQERRGEEEKTKQRVREEEQRKSRSKRMGGEERGEGVGLEPIANAGPVKPLELPSPSPHPGDVAVSGAQCTTHGACGHRCCSVLSTHTGRLDSMSAYLGGAR